MAKQATKQAPLAEGHSVERHSVEGHSAEGHQDVWIAKGNPAIWSQPLKFALLISITWNFWMGRSLLALDTLKPDQWRTGSQFFDQLEAPVSVDWQDNPLNQALSRLALSQRTAIFLDRRINPDQKISLHISAQPLREMLDSLASQANAGVGFVNSVIYLGPRFTAERLATVAEMQNQLVRKLSKDAQKVLLEKRPAIWPRLSEPARLLNELTREVGVSVDNKEVLFHDLWPEYSLPPLTFPERLSLLLAGFRMSYRFLPDEETIQLTRFPKTVFVEKEYPAGNDPAGRSKQLEELIPRAFIEIRGDQILVRSLLEDHWEIQRQRTTAKATRSDQDQTKTRNRYSLTVQSHPVGALLKGLAKRLSMSIEFAESSQKQLDQRVTFSVNNVTADELLNTVAAPARLKVEIREDTIAVSADDQ